MDDVCCGGECGRDRKARATSLRGKILREPMDIPGVGRIAILQDLAGAWIAIARFDQHRALHHTDLSAGASSQPPTLPRHKPSTPRSSAGKQRRTPKISTPSFRWVLTPSAACWISIGMRPEHLLTGSPKLASKTATARPERRRNSAPVYSGPGPRYSTSDAFRC